MSLIIEMLTYVCAQAIHNPYTVTVDECWQFIHVNASPTWMI